MIGFKRNLEKRIVFMFRMVQELMEKQNKEGLNQKELNDLEYFKQRRRTLLEKMRKEYE